MLIFQGYKSEKVGITEHCSLDNVEVPKNIESKDFPGEKTPFAFSVYRLAG